MSSEAVALRAERKRREVQTELVNAALDVFIERGYHATRIADITAHLGVGQSTFYKHFDGKKDVVTHVLNELVTEAMLAVADENAADAAETLDDYLEQAHRITVRLFDTLVRDPRALRILLLEAISVDRDLERQWGLVLRAMKSVVAKYYRNGMAKGYFREDIDVDASSDAVLGLLLGGLWRLLGAPADRAGYLRYVDVALGMIVSAAAAAPGSA